MWPVAALLGSTDLEVKYPGSGPSLCGSTSQLYHQLAVLPWASHSPSLCFSFSSVKWE